MKNKPIKILAFALAAVTFVCGLTGCSGNGGKTDDPTDNRIKETSYDLVSGGRTDYTVVYPEDMANDSYVDIAVEELCNFFTESTGNTIACVSDKGLTHKASNKYISIGNTALLASSGIEVDTSALGGDGYKIKTVDQSVYLYGKTTYGTLYSVYEFLNRQFGYEFFAKDCYSLEKNVKSKKLLDFDYAYTPSIAQRFMADGTLNYDSESARRMRSAPVDSFLVAPDKGRWHTTQGLVRIETYLNPDDPENYHPEFFGYNLPEEESANTGSHSYYEAVKKYPTVSVDEETAKKNRDLINGRLQLCFSGRPHADGKDDGTPADQTPLVNAIVKQMKYFVDKFVESKVDDNDLYMCFTQMDNFDWCECDYCRATTAEYGGSMAAGYIVVANKVADIMYDYVKSTYGREFTTFIFAYQNTEKPPVRETNGKYEPILDGRYGDDIILSKHVSLLYAPIAACYYNSFYDEVNVTEYERMEQWRLLTDNVGVWTYGKTFYHDFFVPMNSYNSLKENFNFFMENKVNFLHAQGQSWNRQCTEWNDLKTYLNASLAWDYTQDMDEMIDKFFTNFYGDAAPAMRKWFDDFRLWHTAQTESRGWNYRGTSAGRKTMDASFYPYGKLMQWQKNLDEAYAAIEKYKTSDPALYDKLERRITKDGLSLKYLIYNLHESTIGYAEADRIYRQMMEDAVRVGVTECKEDRPLEELLRTTVL